MSQAETTSAATGAGLSVDYSGAPGRTKPFSAFERMLAFRYLRARRKEAFISVIAGFSFAGIMLGVATLIVVMAVMNGFRADLFDRIIGLNGHLIVQPADGELVDYDPVSGRISGLSGVKYALPLVDGQALASAGPNGTYAFVRGLSADSIEKITALSDNVQDGSFENFDDPDAPGLAIGRGFADKLGVRVGETIRLIAPDGDATPMGITPRDKAYPVNVIFEMGMSEYDTSVAIMPLGEAQLFFNSEDTVSAIEVFLEDPDAVDDVKPSVFEVAERPIYLSDWRQRHASFFQALEVERNVMFMILTLIVLVAAFNVVSGLIMLVKDKGRDIAILRTMGATRNAILRIFLMTGFSIGLVGTIVGFLLGLLVCWQIQPIQQFISWMTGAQLWDPTVRFLTEIPAKIDMGETLTVLVMSLSLSFLATIFPAWRAAKLDPVEALRYE
jgi:lipoprotein-releasing system permease protein